MTVYLPSVISKKLGVSGWIIQSASVTFTIRLYVLALLPTTKLTGVDSEAPMINLLPIKEAFWEVDTLRYRISARDVSGTLVAHNSDVTNAGYEQAYYNQMTISTADVNANKVLMFFFRADSSVNSDYTINATVKYHLR